MPQPPPPANSTPGLIHSWPNDFIVQWTMSFIPDMSFVPPYSQPPKTPQNVTKGTTFYHVIDGDIRNMREDYMSFCIPVFAAFNSNDFNCSFINRGDSNTSFVLFGPTRPKGAPECCIIGRPFHPPPPNFAAAMPLHYRDSAAGKIIDWNVVWDKEAGPFAYGFSENAAPAYFYMEGIMADAPLWMWQDFSNYQPGEVPPATSWVIPDACNEAKACPGW